MKIDCVFCQIVRKDLPSHIVWEDEQHMAFLSIFPNTEGTTVVITKKHYSSYIFDIPNDVMIGLLNAAKTVAKKIDAAFDDVGRTGVVFEGFGVDHVHAKLFPLHGTKIENWHPIKSDMRTFFEKYTGYISSHNGERADDIELEEIARRIRDVDVR